MPYFEGTLSIAPEDDPNPHFQIDFQYTYPGDTMPELSHFKCNTGRGIDVLIQDHWLHGRVELGYMGTGVKGYWYLATGEGDILLHVGMTARFEDRYR